MMRSGVVTRGRSLLAILSAGTALSSLVFLPDTLMPAGLNFGAAGLGAGLVALLLSLIALYRSRKAMRAAAAAQEEAARSIRAMEERLRTADAGLGMGATADLAADLASLGIIVGKLAEAISAQEWDLLDIRRTDQAVSHPPATPREPAPAAPTPHGPSFVPSFLPPLEQMPFYQPAPDPVGPDAGAIMIAISEHRIDVHVEPIVTLPQRRPLVHELFCLLRLPDGTALLPDEYRPTLGRLGLTADLDDQLLGHALEAARLLAAGGQDGVLATPLSRRALTDAAVLDRMESRVAREPAADRIILAIDGADWLLASSARTTLTRFARHGVGFALTNLARPPSDPAPLAECGVRYVKVSGSRLFDPSRPDETSRATEAACRLLAAHGVRLVASDIVDDRIVPELIECGVPLAQGFALFIPRPIEALFPDHETQPVAAMPEPDPSSPSDRRSLRSVLRRTG